MFEMGVIWLIVPHFLQVTNDGQLVWKEDASDTTSGEVLFKAGARG